MRKSRRSALALACLLALAGCTDVPAATPTALPSKVSVTPKPSLKKAELQLPRGGRRILPDHQLVAFVGAPGSPALGPLDADLDERAQRLEQTATSYSKDRRALPVMELIVVMAQGSAGRDGKYRSRIPSQQIDRYLAVARKHKMLLVLGIQPGQAKPLTEIRRLEQWLKQPDVGLALDPEWEVGPGQVPGRVFGRTSGAELNSIAAYLSTLVTTNRLPEKLFVFHQLSKPIVRNEAALRTHLGIVTVKSVDGIGARTDKLDTYNRLITGLPQGIHTGFKLFYDEDTRHGPLMTPPQVLAIRPRPELVTYE
jgi:hypothetical protein